MAAETKVLVVEDDREINELLGEYLLLEELKYVQALSGKAAIQLAASAQPDTIILDLMLPDIDGYQVAHTIASHRRTYDIPVIMLTCMNQDAERLKGLAAGAHRYMNKPFLPDDLLANVRSALEWKRALATRPAQGRIDISSADPIKWQQDLNEMVRDLFRRTALSDRAVGQIRAGLTLLADWALDWGKQRARDPQLVIEYRITDSSGALSTNGTAAAIHWEISEVQPGLLDEMLFSRGASPLAAVANSKEQLQPSPLARWYHFLAKCGIGRFDKDTKAARVHLQRDLGRAATGVPVVVIDGTRVPTRLSHEAAPHR